ncbi:MAG: ATP:cob(I)alamin adenosyltransferase [Coriobacteriia bacterium]|nr:ATP:cob(I)alamin adenosyltransferase [Coriobacteriia bacterium]
MPYYSSKGDRGTTSFGPGISRSKASENIAFVGALDEAQAALGFAAAEATKHPVTAEVNECLVWMQRTLFKAGVVIMDASSEALDTKGVPWSWEAQVQETERLCEIFALQEALKSFVLPGGSELAARIELARVLIRKLERSYCQMLEIQMLETGKSDHRDSNGAEAKTEDRGALPLFNRLSSLAFVLARYSNEILEVSERNL